MSNLVRVIRLDGRPLTKAQFTPEGYLDDRPILTSVGIFEYANPDGSVRRELRLPEEVFAPESLESYRGKPIIITHDAGLIDKDNVSDEQIGTILTNGYRSGDDVRAEIFIHDTDKMKDSGLKELSLGYNLDLDETPGEYNGQPYDAIQRNIRINHLALVANARAGEQARLNIDSRDKVSEKGETRNMAKTKKTNRADGVLTPEELAKAIEDYKAKHTAKDADEEKLGEDVVMETPAPDAVGEKKEDEAAAAEEKPATLEAQVEAVKERHEDDEDVQLLCDIIDTLLAQKAFGETAEKTDDVDELEAMKGDEDDTDETLPEDDEVKEDGDDLEDEDKDEEFDGDDENCDSDDEDTDPGQNTELKQLNTDSIDRIVRERVKLGLVGRKLNMDGLEDLSIRSAKKAIIKAVRPGIRLDGKSNAYINAAYDLAAAEINSRATKDTGYQKRQMFNKDSREAAPVKTESSEARARMIARAQNKNKED